MSKSSSFKPFKFYSDPGHGWLAVKRWYLHELKIADKITPFSYQKGETVYLEEDQDVDTFFKAFKERWGVDPTTIEGSSTNKQSPIRSYASYDGCTDLTPDYISEAVSESI